MKILYCILDNRLGGPHRRAHSISLRLREQGIETIFLTGRKTNDVWHPPDTTVVQLKHIQCFQRRLPLLNLLRFIGCLPWNVYRIGHLIRSQGIDIVHVDGVTNFVPALAARLTRRPVVWLYNDHLVGPLKRLLRPLLMAFSTVVLVQGESPKAARTADNPKLRRKTTVLYSAVDPRQFDPARYSRARKDQLKHELGVPPDCAIVGMVGNVNRFKGHVYFIEAARDIKKATGPVKFLIVGRKLDTDLGYWNQLQQLTVRHGLQNDVIFTGFRDDPAAVMAILDVFVLASILESCPVVVLEAMAMEVPVVATDVGAVSELIVDGQTGSLVPTRDARAIAQAVLAYLGAPHEIRAAVTRAARERVQREFSTDRIAAQQRRIYGGLIR